MEPNEFTDRKNEVDGFEGLGLDFSVMYIATKAEN